MRLPSVGSAPASRLKENCGTLTPMRSGRDTRGTSALAPIMTYSANGSVQPQAARWGVGKRNRTRVAMAIMSRSAVLDTNGKDRDARTLHSITLSFSSCTRAGKGAARRVRW